MLTGNSVSDFVSLEEGNRDYKTYTKSNLPRKLQTLFEHKDFEPKLSWMAKMLDVSLDEIQEALDLLESIGIIKWENGQPQRMSGHISIDKYYQRSKSQHVADHRIISHQLLNDIDAENHFFVHNGFEMSDQETLREYYRKLREVQNWFMEASQLSQKDLLVGYSFTGANVLKDDPNGGSK